MAQVWASRYDSLRLNTSRSTSALAGHPFPRAFGRFPTRDQYVGYLREYHAQEGITVHTGCTATRVDRATAGWTVETTTGLVTSGHVVVATGPFNHPWSPAWAENSPSPGSWCTRRTIASRHRSPAGGCWWWVRAAPGWSSPTSWPSAARHR